MARSKALREQAKTTYAGREYLNIELVDYLFLGNVAIEEIARILNVEEKAFVAKYQNRLDDLEKIHKGLLVKALFDKALSGDKSSIDDLLTKYDWKEKSSSSGIDDFVSTLRDALLK